MIEILEFDVPSQKTWHLVIQGVRNSWESYNLSDSTYENDKFSLGQADKNLLLKLILAGADHGKFMRQLPVVMDFIAPELFLKQLDTYKISTTRNSTSTMHTLGRDPIRKDMFAGNVSDDTVQKLNNLRDSWVCAHGWPTIQPSPKGTTKPMKTAIGM